ncbi:MAG TPA: hypothetical protein DD638_02830 [Pasteurellaceae bacterium]|nr:hypothetical protein [Pasteurellaceae bacterium]
MNKEQALALTTARWLNTHIYFFVITLFLSYLALKLELGFLFSCGFWLITFYSVYLHIRLAFDHKIFQDFALHQLTPEEFDQSLLTLRLTHYSPLREMQERCISAMKLWKQMVYVTIAQAVIVII